MDFAAKLGFILLVMAVLYLVAQSFSESKESVNFVPESPEVVPTPDPLPEDSVVEPRTLKGVTIQNYGFATIDLRTGPDDPTDFFDELHVRFFFRDRGGIAGLSDHQAFTVCTPKGIATKMASEGWVSLLPDGYIVVARYDIGVILETILDLVTDEGHSQPLKPHEPPRPGAERLL
jgi:hypothetical protein